MKRFFCIFIALFLANFVFSQTEDSPKFPEDSVIQFDAKKLFEGGDYDDVSVLNKTGEKISFSVLAWSEKDSDWVRYGSLKTSDYNDTDTISKALRYKVTPMNRFRYFAITATKPKIEVLYSIEKKDETAAITINYAKAVRPLASLESRAIRNKNGDGIHAEFSFRNISGKMIRSVEITLKATDKGMVVKNHTTGADETTVRTKDSIKDGERYKTQTSAFWTDFAIDEIKITRVKITFEDGTEESYSL